MQLPLDTLLQLIADPADPSKDVLAIAVLCHRCSQIETYSLAADSSDRAAEDRLVGLDRTEGMNLLKWLQCDEATCQSHIPLIETWSNAIPHEEQGSIRLANLKEFGWTGLFCPNGHPVPFPQ